MFSRLFDNPITVKELQGRMRNYRTFILLTSYLGLMGLIVGFTYYYQTDSYSFTRYYPGMRQELGKSIFTALFLAELVLIYFIAPGLTSGAITSERERQTLDILKTTLITPRAMIYGKLGPAVIYLLLLIFTTVPIVSITFMFGGAGIPEMLIASILLLLTGIFLCALGIFFSSGLKSTTAATISSYGSILSPILLIVVFYFVINTLSPSDYTVQDQINMISELWVIASVNPFLAAYLTQVMLVEDQSLFLISIPLDGNINITLLSPWIIYTIFYIIMIILLIEASIRLISQPEK